MLMLHFISRVTFASGNIGQMFFWPKLETSVRLFFVFEGYQKSFQAAYELMLCWNIFGSKIWAMPKSGFFV